MLFSSSRHTIFEICCATVSQSALVERKFPFGLFITFRMDHNFRERILQSEMPDNVSVLFTRDTLLTTMRSSVLSPLGSFFHCLRQTMSIF